MIDFAALLSDTNAYRTVKGDKDNQRLSHAYLILTADGENLGEYLKIFARLMVCKDGAPCGKCRRCRLIGENAFSDVYFYPKNGVNVLSDDVNELIEESYVKPIECDKKIFIISQAQTMNAAAQNKLLKTLGEPPTGVHIIIGATSEFALLPTVKSRVKKLEIPAFSKDKLFSALKNDCPDAKKLDTAIACGDGTVGKALRLYGDEKLSKLTELAIDTLVNMTSSKDVLEYSNRILAANQDPSEFMSVLELMLRDMLADREGATQTVLNGGAIERLRTAQNFCTGSIINALEKINEAEKRKKFNANPTMLIEWLLFQILEGKYKWQKL